MLTQFELSPSTLCIGVAVAIDPKREGTVADLDRESAVLLRFRIFRGSDGSASFIDTTAKGDRLFTLGKSLLTSSR